MEDSMAILKVDEKKKKIRKKKVNQKMITIICK